VEPGRCYTTEKGKLPPFCIKGTEKIRIFYYYYYFVDLGSRVLAADLASWNVSVWETERFGERGGDCWVASASI